MVQGGDPTGTGKGGECIWGGTFADELHPDLRECVSSMASITYLLTGTIREEWLQWLTTARILMGLNSTLFTLRKLI